MNLEDEVMSHGCQRCQDLAQLISSQYNDDAPDVLPCILEQALQLVFSENKPDSLRGPLRHLGVQYDHVNNAFFCYAEQHNYDIKTSFSTIAMYFLDIDFDEAEDLCEQATEQRLGSQEPRVLLAIDFHAAYNLWANHSQGLPATLAHKQANEPSASHSSPQKKPASLRGK
eukprot:m.293560 g.293560  ORF g.293560 m.293560 type:complete len:171 (+) comp25110_c0_seq1:319-831(+)